MAKRKRNRPSLPHNQDWFDPARPATPPSTGFEVSANTKWAVVNVRVAANQESPWVALLKSICPIILAVAILILTIKIDKKDVLPGLRELTDQGWKAGWAVAVVLFLFLIIQRFLIRSLKGSKP